MTLHSIVGLRGINNEFEHFYLSSVGILEFPKALKRDLFMSTISCQSFFIEANESATNKGFLIVCDASFYIDQNGVVKKNILGMFQHRTKVKTIYFHGHKLPITTPQDRLQIEIVDSEGVLQNVSALATFDIAGCVSNKLLAI